MTIGLFLFKQSFMCVNLMFFQNTYVVAETSSDSTQHRIPSKIAPSLQGKVLISVHTHCATSIFTIAPNACSVVSGHPSMYTGLSPWLCNANL